VVNAANFLPSVRSVPYRGYIPLEIRKPFSAYSKRVTHTHVNSKYLINNFDHVLLMIDCIAVESKVWKLGQASC